MTIYALSTGPGVSGVAIIRVSGHNASEVIELITNKKLPKPRVATLRKIKKINTSELIDEGIIIWFPAPENAVSKHLTLATSTILRITSCVHTLICRHCAMLARICDE